MKHDLGRGGGNDLIYVFFVYFTVRPTAPTLPTTGPCCPQTLPFRCVSPGGNCQGISSLFLTVLQFYRRLTL